MEWVVLLVVIVILGALAGGNSIGETIRKGCGLLVLLFIALIVFLALVGEANALQTLCKASLRCPAA